ncbi:hypothetical protein [Halobellus sp. EA9]|uniref:hypothetical protein n=1 Tax=Halobellus sp. EA9 TaxID=3421647 RepID=UPI003EB97CD9
MTDDDELAELRVRTDTGDRLDTVNDREGDEVDDSGSETDSDETPESNTGKKSAMDPSEGQNKGLDGGSDTDASPVEEASSDSNAKDEDPLVATIDAKIDELEGPETGVHIWGEHLAATIAVIESDPELKEEVIASLESRRGTEIDVESQSEFLGHILHVGLEEVAPDVVAALREATKQRALREL